MGFDTGMAQSGDTQELENYGHDLIQDMNARLKALCRYDQYIANAEGHQEIQQMWHEFKRQEHENVKRLRQCLRAALEDSPPQAKPLPVLQILDQSNDYELSMRQVLT